jgi:hypothetical protein
MFKEDQYIKSIEKYFLTHIGKGIMLPYSDYELIAGWKDKDIPLQIIIEGIRDAFSDSSNFNSINKESKIRDLSSISNYIEKSIETYKEVEMIDEKPDTEDSSQSVKHFIETINSSIKNVEDKRVIKIINEYKNSLLKFSSNDDTQIFKIIIEKQNSIYDEIFNLLSASEQNKILTRCESKLGDHDNLTVHAYQKSINSFRNKILKDMFKLKFLN